MRAILNDLGMFCTNNRYTKKETPKFNPVPFYAQLLERIKQEKASLESGKKKRARRGRTAKKL